MAALTVPQGNFSLARYPKRPNDKLRAWDAADEYLLQYIATEQLIHPDSNIVILNDSFGALSVALATARPTMVSDSYIAQQGLRANINENQLDASQVQILNSLSPLAEQLPARDRGIDLLIIKITKSLAQLEDSLLRIRPFLTPESRILAGGMVKAIHTSTLNVFERVIGPTHTSLAVKKARLIFSRLDAQLIPPATSYPKTYPLEGSPYQITNHANVFSRERLDIGTRFFMQHLPVNPDFRSIIDLGCGNGIIGLIAAEKNPQATLTFVDESHMAVASAKTNFHNAFPDRDAEFLVTDCLSGIPENSADLILNNPPFHQQNAIGDFIAWQMFTESKAVLKSGGELWVIGNRHLNYHVKLKRVFGNCHTVVSNAKFVILKAIKH